MTWQEFRLARLLLAEEKVGRAVRNAGHEEVSQEAQSTAVLRERGLVD